MNDNMNGNMRRAFFYGLGAVYLIYLAIDMLMKRNTVEGMDASVMLIFSVVFAAAGIGLLIFTIMIVKKNKGKEEKKDDDESKAD